MEQKVEEGDHIMISFSSLESDVFYSAYSVTESGNDPHYYCQKRLAASKTTIVNVSFVILSSGRFILEFSCVDPQAQGCVVGYEANIEYSLY